MIRFLILITLIFSSTAVLADDDIKVYDSQYNYVYTIKESSNGDQKIYDSKSQQVGTIRDGKVYDSKWSQTGTTSKATTSKGTKGGKGK